MFYIDGTLVYNQKSPCVKDVLKIKIWFKGYKKNNPKLSKVFDIKDEEDLFDIVVLCCNEFDLPTPVILEKHKKYFNEFSLVKFSKADFVEQIPYEAIEVEIFE